MGKRSRCKGRCSASPNIWTNVYRPERPAYQTLTCVGFEVLTAIKVKLTAFRIVTLAVVWIAITAYDTASATYIYMVLFYTYDLVDCSSSTCLINWIREWIKSLKGYSLTIAHGQRTVYILSHAKMSQIINIIHVHNIAYKALLRQRAMYSLVHMFFR